MIFADYFFNIYRLQYDDYIVERPFSDIHSPRDVFSNVRDTIRRTQCGTLLNSTEHKLLGNYQLLVMGTGLQPATLIMAAEPVGISTRSYEIICS